ncbi:MAG: MFS transporter [Infirmifilum uzonense]|uniref:MFS transporter n=1 Tax=Infirmifilum uzonense TaxID=1550241 RepID=UPI003C76AB3D
MREFREVFSKVKGLPRNIKVLAAGWLLWSPVQAMSGPYIQLYVSRLGATTEDISIVQSFQQLANAASRVIGGYIADRHGRKKIIIIGTLLVSLIYLLMVFAPDWRSYAILTGLNSLSLFYQPALEGIQADSVMLQTRGRTYAFVNFLSGLASSVAPLGGAAAVNALGIVDGVRLSFLLSAIVGFFIAWMRLRYMEETLPTSDNHGGFVEAYRKALAVMKQHITNLILVDVILNFLGGVTFLGNYYMYYYLGVDKTGLGLLATLGGVTGLLFTLPAGYIADKQGRGFSILWGHILGTLSLLVFVLTPPHTSYTMPLLAFSSLMGSLGGPLYGIAYSTLRADLVPKEHRGRVYALMGIPPVIAWSIGAIIGGWMYNALSPHTPFVAGLILRVLLTPLLIVLFKSVTLVIDQQLTGNGSPAR